MYSFQEDDGGVRGKVRDRLGDIVGEVMAYLVMEGMTVMTSSIIT